MMAMKNYPIRFIVVILCGLCMIGLLYAYWLHVNSKYYTGFVPNKIGAVQLSYFDTNSITPLNLLRGSECGIAIFTLSDEKLSQIKVEGISFFSEARDAGTKNLKGHIKNIKYIPWKETPVSAKFLSDGLSPAFGKPCSVEPRKGMFGDILKAYSAPGNFLTATDSHAELFVIPSMKIAVYSYFN